MRRLLVLVVALAFGFAVYRVAVASMPTEFDYRGSFSSSGQCAMQPGHVTRVFDGLTGFPVGVAISCADRERPAPGTGLLLRDDEMELHWGRSVLLGVVGGVLALICFGLIRLWRIWNLDGEPTEERTAS